MKFNYVTHYDNFTCSIFDTQIDLWNYYNCIVIDLNHIPNYKAIESGDSEFMYVLQKYLCEEKKEHEADIYFDGFDHYVLQGHSLRTIVNHSNEEQLSLMNVHSNTILQNKNSSPEKINKAKACLNEIGLLKKKDVTKSITNKRRSVFSKIRNQVMLAVIDRDGYICQICKVDKNLTVDHIYPLSKGGSDDLDNLQLLCRACNSRKNDK